MIQGLQFRVQGLGAGAPVKERKRASERESERARARERQRQTDRDRGRGGGRERERESELTSRQIGVHEEDREDPCVLGFGVSPIPQSSLGLTGVPHS